MPSIRSNKGKKKKCRVTAVVVFHNIRVASTFNLEHVGHDKFFDKIYIYT